MEEKTELKPGTKDFLKAENEAQKAELEAKQAEMEAMEAELKSLKEQLEAAKVKHVGENQEVSEAPSIPAVPRMVRIKLPLTRTEKDDVFVGLNGKTYLIKRGVPVDVPEGVAKVLERREKMLSVAMEYEAAAAAPLAQLAQMYN